MRMIKKATWLALAAGLATGSQAMAQGDATLSWNNAAGGAASTTTNWAPNAMPVATDDLTFNLLATYAVTFSNLVPTAHTHTYKRGTVTLTMSSPHTVSSGIIVGDLSGDLATATLTTGTWNSGGPITIGNAAGSNGTLNVNDDDADLLMTGTTSDMIVGSNAPGTLSITGGGLVRVADQFIAGNNATGTSSVTVSGATNVLPLVRSTLSVLGTGVASKLGQGGDATVAISNGALADFAGDVVVSNGTASTSTVTIAGLGGILAQSATLDVAGDLLLGRNISAGTAAGVATINVNADGTLVVGGTLFVAGDPDGGAGTVHTATGGLITTNSLSVGNGFALDLNGGAIDIDGGTLAWSATTSSPRFNGGTGNPVITMIGGATATLTPTAGGPALVVGGGAGANLCDFDVRFGSDLTTTGSVMLGEGADDTGGMIINGTGSTLTMPAGSTLTAGSAGEGHFQAELGATVTGSRLSVAASAGSIGGALFESLGTTATFDSVYVGGSISGAGGNGDMAVNAQSVLNVTSPGSIIVYAPGHLEVAQGAVLNAPGVNPLVHGVMELENNGTMNAGLTQVTSGGILRGPNNVPGAGTLNSRTRLLAGSTLELVNGDLTVGNSSAADGFEAQDNSLVSVGAHILTVLDSDRALFDDVTINGGEIIAPNGMEIVTPGTNGRLDGTGTITTSILFMESGGSVITSTGANGITINGKFRNNSGFIDGTKYTFNENPAISDSGWTGDGAIDARVVFNAGTKVVALADMSMGLNVTDGVTFNLGSELHANTRDITLIDSNGIGLGSLTEFDGGTITCTQPLTVNNGRIVQGRGHLQTPLLTLNGRIKPGFLSTPSGGVDDTIADIRIDGLNGSFVMGANAIYDCDLGVGIEFNQADRILANGPITLSGTLNVTLVPGFSPAAHDIYEVAVGSSRTGVFTTVNIVPVGPFGPAHVEYTPTKANVVVCYANCDGSQLVPALNVQDFSCFLNRFAAGDSYANCDGSTIAPALNVQDFACFLNKYAAGCP